MHAKCKLVRQRTKKKKENLRSRCRRLPGYKFKGCFLALCKLHTVYYASGFFLRLSFSLGARGALYQDA